MLGGGEGVCVCVCKLTEVWVGKPHLNENQIKSFNAPDIDGSEQDHGQVGLNVDMASVATCHLQVHTRTHTRAHELQYMVYTHTHTHFV